VALRINETMAAKESGPINKVGACYTAVLQNVENLRYFNDKSPATYCGFTDTKLYNIITHIDLHYYDSL